MSRTTAGRTTASRIAVGHRAVGHRAVHAIMASFLATAVGSGLVACGGPDEASSDQGIARAAAQAAGPSADAGVRTVPTTARPTVRGDDVTDVAELARSMADSATGDEPWVEVFSELRARSWLATRYPGRYDLTTIYGGEAAESAEANEGENLALGVFVDEPLPSLVSVIESRTLGELVELEVVLEAGPATVRGEADDQPRGVLAGGIHRGLFTVARDGPGASWRIHSVTELQVAVTTTGQEPTP